MISRNADSAIANQRLRVSLRNARAEANLSQGEVGKALKWSAKRVLRLETGESPISVSDVEAMASLYGIDPIRTQELIKLTEASTGPAWWSSYRNVISAEFGLFLSFERAATQLRYFHPLLVHGLLQTESYANALLTRSSNPVQLISRKKLRMARKEIFTRADPPEVTIILGEAALHNRVGSAEIMNAQLQSLQQAAGSEALNLGIVPFEQSVYPAMLMGFDLARLSETETTLFLESPPASRTTKDETTLNELFGDFFSLITSRARFGSDAVALITAILEKQARADSGQENNAATRDQAAELGSSGEGRCRGEQA